MHSPLRRKTVKKSKFNQEKGESSEVMKDGIEVITHGSVRYGEVQGRIERSTVEN